MTIVSNLKIKNPVVKHQLLHGKKSKLEVTTRWTKKEIPS
jgi:hypothetical protein